jgi:tetratricopeptide (TPR) repeat protein
VAHDLCHTVTNPLVTGLATTGAQEHLVHAVTLRIMAQELGEQIYREMLAEYTVRDFPYLASLGERLKEYEAERGRYKTLKEFYPRLATIFRPSPESDTDSRVRRLKDEGVKEFMEGRFTDAAKTFTDALALAPKDPETLLNIGVVYEKLGKKSKALESYGRAIDLGAANSARARELKVSAYSSRATLLFSLGRAAEARQDIRRALEAAPSDWEGREDLEHRLSP